MQVLSLKEKSIHQFSGNLIQISGVLKDYIITHLTFPCFPFLIISLINIESDDLLICRLEGLSLFPGRGSTFNFSLPVNTIEQED
jgi:hypothetical protein